MEWPPGELYPRVGYIVSNMARPNEKVVAFYNKRGTCEQWIKEGNPAERPHSERRQAASVWACQNPEVEVGLTSDRHPSGECRLN